ncbi:MAG: cytochrome c biogenesis protein CcdA [Candidatus Omnitrophica bacterium]|nr:cytochrome c biogenesis protein CcdA [Candidatus Omnitrophota bacterium]
MTPDTISFGWVFLAGVLTFLSPCVLPLIPSYISYITGASIEELQTGKGVKRATAIHSLLFILGFSVIFVLLGASATLVSGALYQYQDWIKNVGGILIILFGLHLMGILPLHLLLKEKRLQWRRKPVGYAGSFLVGAAFSIGWTPCVGPILASVLLYAGSQTTVTQGVLMLAVYSLGMGIPFFFSSLAFNQLLTSLKWLRKYLNILEKLTGALLVLVGILLLTNSLAWLSGVMTQWLAPLSRKLNI